MKKLSTKSVMICFLLASLCCPTALVYGKDDGFIQGALDYYRTSVIMTQDDVSLETFYFMGYINSYTTTLQLHGVSAAPGGTDGIRFEVISRYIFDHPEERDDLPQALIDNALGQKWPQWYDEVATAWRKANGLE